MNNEALVLYKMARPSSQEQAGGWENWGTFTSTSAGGVPMTPSNTSISIKPAGQITVDPSVRGGVPCVGIAKSPIATMLKYLAQGLEPEKIVIALPDISLADVRSALSAAAWVMREPVIDWQAMNLPAMVQFQDEMWAWEAAGVQALAKTEEASDTGD